MKCPISIRKHNKEYGALTIEDIIVVIHDAIKLGFRGMVGFQYYNEPMLYIDRIQKVIERVPEVDYLLWTNGTLLDRSIEKNEILTLFKQVVITCYNKEELSFYEVLKEYYKNICIVTWELDNMFSRQITLVTNFNRKQFCIP